MSTRLLSSPSRPHVLLSGAFDARGGVHGRISCFDDFARVHRLRERMDAVAVGARTFIEDAPRLDVRAVYLGRPARRQPWRVVFSGRSRIEDRTFGGRRLVVVGESTDIDAEVLVRAPGRELAPGLRTLRRMGIETLLLEGGPTLWHAAIDEGVADCIEMFVATDHAACAVEIVAASLSLNPETLRGARSASGHLVTGAVTPTVQRI